MENKTQEKEKYYKLREMAWLFGMSMSLVSLIVGYSYHWILGTCSLISLICFVILFLTQEERKKDE